jgi:hypothetical protein
MKVLVPRQVPWVSWADWRVCRDLLFSDVRAERVRGVELVSMWRARGKVPHAVNSSSDMVENQLNDEDTDVVAGSDMDAVGGTRRSQNELKMQYSMVLVRTVNGFVDTQQTGYYAESAFNISKRIGLPAWVVEMRHDATHNQLPSLPVLRSAATDVLKWLQSYYWAPQESMLEALEADIIREVGGEDEGVEERRRKKRGNRAKEQKESPRSSSSSSSSAAAMVQSSLSYATSSFLPVFFEMAIVLPASTHENSADVEAIRSDAAATVQVGTVLWEAALHDMYDHNPSLPLVLLCHILDRAMAVAKRCSASGESPTGSDLFVLSSCFAWVSVVSGHCSEYKARCALETDDTLSQQWARYVIMSALNTHTAWLGMHGSVDCTRILEVLRLVCSEGEQTQQQRQQQQQQPQPPPPSKCARNESGISVAHGVTWKAPEDVQPWPLGLPLGQLVAPDLTLPL